MELKMACIRLMACLQRHTKVFRENTTMRGGGCLKRILTYLYRAKYNEIHIGHSYIQKYVSYKT